MSAAPQMKDAWLNTGGPYVVIGRVLLSVGVGCHVRAAGHGTGAARPGGESATLYRSVGRRSDCRTAHRKEVGDVVREAWSGTTAWGRWDRSATHNREGLFL